MNNEFNFEANPYGGFAPQEKKQKNGFAIASLVLGIVSLVGCCCCCTEVLGMIVMGVSAVLAIVFAFLSKKNEGKLNGMAIAGLVLGIISIVVLLCFIVAIVGTFSLLDSMTEAEMIAYLDENLKPMLEGDEETYNEFIEMIKAVYAQRAGE